VSGFASPALNADNEYVVLRTTLSSDPRVRSLCERLAESKTPLAASGLWGSSAPILAAIAADVLRRPLLYIAAHLDAADEAREDIETALQRACEVLPAYEAGFGEGSAAGEINAERTRLCAALLTSEPLSDSGGAAQKSPHEARASHRKHGPEAHAPSLPVIVAPIQALIQPVPTAAALAASSLDLCVGEDRDPGTIARFLLERGFERLDQVEEPGDFAIRGGILDVFAVANVDPYRVEFFGDRIESIRQFEISTQRSVRTMQSVRITLPPDPARCKAADLISFLEYLPASTIIALHEPAEIMEIGRAILDRLGSPVGHYPVEAVIRRAGEFNRLDLVRFAGGSVPDEDVIPFDTAPLPTFETKSTDAIAQLLALCEEQPAQVFCDNRGEQERLRELIAQVAWDRGREAPRAESLDCCIGYIHSGFIWKAAIDGGAEREEDVPADEPEDAPPVEARWERRRPDSLSGLAIIPHHELFRRYTQKRRIHKIVAGRPIESFLDLTEGDYVVHVLHGIARYVGMKTMRKGDSHKLEEFLTLHFADDAVLHVPVSQIDLVQKYIGAKAQRPPLSKLGGTRWQTTREKVEEALTDLAGDLLRIQAARESRAGIAFPQDTHWQREFESAFLYTETPDQLTTLQEIKHDMLRPRPMDRLLCGDVGYGKTELAMRAAFKVIEFGKQVAVLVPTTVLAEQHYRTFTERMADYPFTVACLNRFRSPKEQREIVTAARKGQIDVLIGTHRLLSKDVGFADLGLVIIDEEQRFGVEHKERLKHLRTTVDVLTLTATPIPRTLHMSMIGLRDISSLATPPMDRRAIATQVCGWSDALIREALIRELNREGQVYFVHNRVRTIHSIAAKIMSLVPEARVLVGHGQMHGDELEEVMTRFVRREADILVSTAIIESGLDIPNANTIFIDRADTFGLADLHQLRGRVGRYKHRAFCYLLLSPNRPLTSTAAKRLKAIEQYSELGAGFRIAMRDLEIRGAGNILGPEQSGNIALVGYELYCQLLEQTVKRMRGEPHAPRVSVHLELDVEAYIPKGYIASDRQRMECYRRLAACRRLEDVEQLEKDLHDAFGRYPETLETLLILAEIKVLAAAWNVRKIIRREPDVIFHLDGEIRKLEPLFADAQGAISFPDARTLHWRPPENYFHGQTLLRVLRNLFRRAAATPSPAIAAGDPSAQQAPKGAELSIAAQRKAPMSDSLDSGSRRRTRRQPA